MRYGVAEPRRRAGISEPERDHSRRQEDSQERLPGRAGEVLVRRGRGKRLYRETLCRRDAPAECAGGARNLRQTSKSGVNAPDGLRFSEGRLNRAASSDRPWRLGSLPNEADIIT